MSDELLVKQGAPTLAGIKTGNLFPCSCESRERLWQEVRELNRRLVPKGLCLLPLRCSEHRALLYLYRPEFLRQDLQDRQAEMLLRQAGYPCGNVEQCLTQLIQRLQRGGEFPHEIGLFLSYPPEDVRGFIEHRAGDFKCVGTWKVYGDENRAKRLFAAYKKCTAVYYAGWQAGKSIEQLAVATI